MMHGDGVQPNHPAPPQGEGVLEWSYSLTFHGPALLPFAGTFSQAQKLYVGVDAASLANSGNTTLRTMVAVGEPTNDLGGTDAGRVKLLSKNEYYTVEVIQRCKRVANRYARV